MQRGSVLRIESNPTESINAFIDLYYPTGQQDSFSLKGFKGRLENTAKRHSASLIVKCVNALKRWIRLDSAVMERCWENPTFTYQSTTG